MKKAIAILTTVLLVVGLASCSLFAADPTPSTAPATTPPATEQPTPEPTPEATPEPTPSPTPKLTATPSQTPAPAESDNAGSSGILFDIYGSTANVDLNHDGTKEQISFTAASAKSTVTINGKSYDVAQKGLAQQFAVTDIDTSDKITELVFTDAYKADLADSEKAYSYLYWWTGSKLTFMGKLMDVKFAGDWRKSFKAANFTDGKGQVMCLAHTTELTDIWYTAYYKTSGSARSLYEWRHAAAPIVGDKDPLPVLTCKTVCLLQTDHTEVNKTRDKPTYMGDAYKNYWVPTESPTTKGRVKNPAEGIILIAQAGEKLTIVSTYGPTWFKVKTKEGYLGWIYCKSAHVGGYYASMKWTAADMFDGLVNAG